jgi:dTDP-L-rhamnose 4-epimerase
MVAFMNEEKGAGARHLQQGLCLDPTLQQRSVSPFVSRRVGVPEGVSMRRVLITGGAGFIGSHVAAALLEHGWQVRVLDNLDPQVHEGRVRPAYLHPEADLRVGDVRDPVALSSALEGVEAVCHLAAAVGVGQSMYQVDRYVSVNDLGTAALLQALTERRRVRRLVVASSMSIYGEGRYTTVTGEEAQPRARSATDLARGDWDVRGSDGTSLVPAATPEVKVPTLSSVYAITKYAQERYALSVGEAYRIPTVALRFFNVYGPHQALSNPYTGVLAIFASRLLNGRPPIVFEDGRQRRDFVSVHDVATACRLAIEADEDVSGVFNIGSGEAHSIADIATRLAAAMDRASIQPEITFRYRVGDIRHCFADISLARRRLGYAPRTSLDLGLRELVGWLSTQTAVDRVAQATEELAVRGLTA